MQTLDTNKVCTGISLLYPIITPTWDDKLPAISMAILVAVNMDLPWSQFVYRFWNGTIQPEWVPCLVEVSVVTTFFMAPLQWFTN